MLRKSNPQLTSAELESDLQKAKQAIQIVNTAYAILSDEEKRRQYDHHLRLGRAPSEFVGADLPDGSVQTMFGAFNFEAIFRDVPEGNHIEAKDICRMLEIIDKDLQSISNKASSNSRYRAVADVITTLKSELLASKNIYFENLENERCVSPQVFHDYLIDVIIAVNHAKNTGIPERHRGILRGTPILRELTCLIEALFRLIGFLIYKAYKWWTNDATPVFANGLYQGLFKPAPTRTLIVLNKMEDYMEEQLESMCRYLVNPLSTKGAKGLNGLPEINLTPKSCW